MKRRIGWHILFWLVYTLIYGYTNTAFASKSDLAYPIGIRFLRMWGSELMVLPIKLIAASISGMEYGCSALGQFMWIFIRWHFIKKIGKK